MTEKVKLTKLQAEAIEWLMDGAPGSWTQEDLIREHTLDRHGWSGVEDAVDISVLNGLPLLTLIDALRIGYEIEKEYKVGDWVVHDAGCKLGQIEIVRGKNITVRRTDGEGYWWNTDFIRHATPEEIKAEQERRVWAGIGREPGEFRDGDIIFGDPNSNFGLAITKVVDGWSEKAARSDYYDGHIKGFYPAESFVEFGGGE